MLAARPDIAITSPCSDGFSYGVDERVDEVALDVEHRHAAESSRRHCLAVDFVGDIAGGEHARNICTRGSRFDDDIAVLFQCELTGERFRGGLCARWR